MPDRARLSARPCDAPPLAHEAAVGLHRLDLDAATRPMALHVPVGWCADTPAPLAVMLHGAGGSAAQGGSLLEPFASHRGLLVLAPVSQGSTWDALRGDWGPDVAAIDAALAWLFARYRVDAAHLAVGGFSDGASYALGLALANAELFPRALALSPGFVPRAPGQTPNVAVFIAHGTGDAVLPIGPCSRRIVPGLRGVGVDVTYLEFNGGHEVPPEVASDAVTWVLK
ncbi:alpha/beta hydrolase [Azohydromonas caseinilytica]|uniref:Phospholipase n=1 Tax=Azohydromonas caseinilytica TaxID=2728836 RepID=A0A848FFS1_9BURK|nr:phospholipase [Azohydromonas caseinilytica]NML17685.1 phospholipase [Azohydromonas caseinilytica]